MQVYNPAKPGKYGILFRVITDALTRFVYKMIPYTALPEDDEAAAAYKESNTVPSIVRTLTTSLRHTGRNITMDRYYGHLDLMETLTNDDGISSVATIQADGTEYRRR